VAAATDAFGRWLHTGGSGGTSELVTRCRWVVQAQLPKELQMNVRLSTFLLVKRFHLYRASC
jgi:hypothetical protein